MEQITLTIDGREYVAVPRAEYERTHAASKGNALGFIEASLASRMKLARTEARLTQDALALKLKCSQAMVANAEAGRMAISDKYALRVLKACGLPDNWAPKKSKKLGAR
jgi:ribosome-binding protein aMBF1 (putative translation factor)